MTKLNQSCRHEMTIRRRTRAQRITDFSQNSIIKLLCPRDRPRSKANPQPLRQISNLVVGKPAVQVRDQILLPGLSAGQPATSQGPLQTDQALGLPVQRHDASVPFDRGAPVLGASDRVPLLPMDPALALLESTGLWGRLQCTTAWHHQWKSKPSCSTKVLPSTNGQNGLLNTACTRSDSLSPAPKLAATNWRILKPSTRTSPTSRRRSSTASGSPGPYRQSPLRTARTLRSLVRRNEWLMPIVDEERQP